MQLYSEIDTAEVDEFYRKIALNVKKHRLEKNISQMELALSMGHKSVSSIGKIEAGLENKHYNIENLYKIAKILDVDICNFFKN
ncbi:transcriptional regulator, XRE family [Arcobacter venerupis]|uniref:Transcriptional regulator, XRE family n=1 Tax=Arcobacter venerupis TaxID=1054033 RepID=A0AAE7BC41_9BACT|nr:helix-turn-helix transcriptional regulator [Arcobacter venerupis]QKF68331.1 transcriptional regulator, XRE family [Arcobacter venerupis]RWS48518.1 transcriptional regulator [Arcobacter venerupis]